MLEREVAVKVLPAERAEDPAFVARFEREARSAVALNHPNVVRVFDFGRDADTRFIVMECVAGQNLAQLVRGRGRLDRAQAAKLASEVALALAAAHQAGIVHRDVKPANVVVDDREVAKVLDFGIARAAASTSLTWAAVVLGSAPYMAPEVARGERADERSDIYSRGCVLYELLTGEPPFTGELPAAVLHQHATARPRSPRALNPEVPAGLDALVLRLLAKRPDDRPQTAARLAAELETSLSEPSHVGDRADALCPTPVGGLTPARSVSVPGLADRVIARGLPPPGSQSWRAVRSCSGCSHPPVSSSAEVLGARRWPPRPPTGAPRPRDAGLRRPGHRPRRQALPVRRPHQAVRGPRRQPRPPPRRRCRPPPGRWRR